MGKRTLAQPLHRRGHRHPGAAVDDPDGLGAFPRARQYDDHRGSWRRQRNCSRDLSLFPEQRVGRAGRYVGPQYVANAAARRTASATTDGTEPGLAACPQDLPGRRGWARSRTNCQPRDEWSLTMSILNALLRLGLSVFRVALRVATEVAVARIVQGDDRDLTVCFRRSFVDAGRVPTSRSWTPSTRQLWCYAVILAATRNRPSPPRDTAEPAVPVSPKPCYSRRTEAF